MQGAPDSRAGGAAVMEAPGGPPPAAEAGEVLFLIAEALQGGPFAALGAALAEQAAERGLLPRRHDVHGAPPPPPPLPARLLLLLPAARLHATPSTALICIPACCILAPQHPGPHTSGCPLFPWRRRLPHAAL